MPSQLVRTTPTSPPMLRHPAEVPFFVIMVVLNVVVIAAILWAAVVLPFVPQELKDAGVGVGIRAALIGLLLLVPALIVIRETQRAAVRRSRPARALIVEPP
jgi:hypothetical protein